MRVLVIGASGFIGKQLYNELMSNGISTIGTMNNTYINNLIKFDITKDCIEEKLSYEIKSSQNRELKAVICSSIANIDYCYENQKFSHEVNVNHTIRLIDDLNNLGYKVTFLSTDNVFDGERGFYNELDNVNPLNEYGKQKVQVENYILSKYPNNLILRLSKIMGSNLKEKQPFSEIYDLAKSNKKIYCIKDQIFSPTYVKDVAKGIFCALNKNLNGVYHLANDEYFSRYELAKQFLLYFGIYDDLEVIEKKVEEFNFKDKRVLKTYLDNTKFREACNFDFTSMKNVFNEIKSNMEYNHK